MAATEAQKRSARNRHNNRMAEGLTRLPSVFITEQDRELLERLSEKFGSKKEAIIQGLRLLSQNLEPKP